MGFRGTLLKKTYRGTVSYERGTPAGFRGTSLMKTLQGTLQGYLTHKNPTEEPHRDTSLIRALQGYLAHKNPTEAPC